MSKKIKILIIICILLILLPFLSTTGRIISERNKIKNLINFIYNYQKKCGFYPTADTFESFYTINYKYNGSVFEVEPQYFRGYDDLPDEFMLEYETGSANLIKIGDCSKRKSVIFGGYNYECTLNENNIEKYYKVNDDIDEKFLICNK